MRSSRIVAIRATIVIAAIYLLVALVINVAVASRGTKGLDQEVAETLATLKAASASSTSGQSVLGYFGGGAKVDPDDELDKVPVVYWWVPARGTAIPADTAVPALPQDLYGVSRTTSDSIGSSDFRFGGVQVAGGRWVVATSTAEVVHDGHVLELAELILLPLVLGGFFLFAYQVGRRAAAPIEESRRRQLSFTADASHELRTPLSVIEAEVGSALSKDHDAASYRKSLQGVSAEAKRLRSIVDELLWLARFDSGPERPKNALVDLSALACASAQRFIPVAAQRDIVINIDEADPGKAMLNAPPEWLDRLVSVLVDNACRYSPPNSTVQVSVVAGDAGPILSVDDEGPGISDEEKERIFERFHRASNQEGGSGLGLAIADAVVQATGGRWRVTSSLLGGTKMEVSW